MIKEVIILAGGLGTRLRDVVPDLPKCMAPVADVPFLTHIIRYWLSQGVERFVFSLGYKHEVIEAFLQQTFPTIQYTVVIEEEPLKTGGAIALALQEASSANVLVVNGDTLFKVDLKQLEDFHALHDAACTVALKPMTDFNRYGAVRISEEGRIEAFEEKRHYDTGHINGGVYLLHKERFLQRIAKPNPLLEFPVVSIVEPSPTTSGNRWPAVFSFETAYLQALAHEGQFFGLVQEGYFIDIGIPADYEKAQTDLAKKRLPFELIDETWTLFLDRDGVININKPDSYIFTPDEFILLGGVTEAMAALRQIVGRLIVITNQRGVGRGLMTEEALQAVHNHMLDELQQAGVYVDGIYYCTADNQQHPDRKPNPGLALRAKADFPDIDFSKSIMIGDKLIDMEWGRNIGTFTILIDQSKPVTVSEHPDVDWICPSLFALIDFIPDPD